MSSYLAETAKKLGAAYWIADDGFCSICAGRTVQNNKANGDRKEKCDNWINPFGSRELNNSSNTYFYI